MEKDFDSWNIKKKIVHNRDEKILFHEREIWWCSLGVNVGFEQDGANDEFERPALIIKKFNREVLWILPLTRSNKTNRYYYKISEGDSRDSLVILSQLKLISSKRLLRKMKMLPENDFKQVIERVKKFFPYLP